MVVVQRQARRVWLQTIAATIAVTAAAILVAVLRR